MVRRLTAKRQITKERALSVLDNNIATLKAIADDAKSEGYESQYAIIGMAVLKTVRNDLELRCDYGAFPSDG